MKPTNIILDLLRTYPKQGTSVKELMSVGSMFGFSENLMRVSLSRLVSRDVIVKIKRGFYKLSDISDPVNEFVEQWRLGESRLVHWDSKTWNCLHHATVVEEKAIWAMDRMGFREVSSQLWIRPDNLHLNQADLTSQLFNLGCSRDVVLLASAKVSDELVKNWQDQFDTRQLDNEYSAMTEKLKLSMKSISKQTLPEAKKESFYLGGKAIQLLVKDPLMPYQWHSPSKRQQLCQTMQAYDQVGRSIWATTEDDVPNTTPIQGRTNPKTARRIN